MPDLGSYKILEYLGGIETFFSQLLYIFFFRILEYLGGIETIFNTLQR